MNVVIDDTSRSARYCVVHLGNPLDLSNGCMGMRPSRNQPNDFDGFSSWMLDVANYEAVTPSVLRLVYVSRLGLAQGATSASFADVAVVERSDRCNHLIAVATKGVPSSAEAPLCGLSPGGTSSFGSTCFLAEWNGFAGSSLVLS